MIEIKGLIAPGAGNFKSAFRDLEYSGICRGEEDFYDFGEAEEDGWCDGCPNYLDFPVPGYDGKIYKTCEAKSGTEIFRFAKVDLALTSVYCTHGVGKALLSRLPVSFTLTAPLYWWEEFESIAKGEISTDETPLLTPKELNFDDFSFESFLDIQKDNDTFSLSPGIALASTFFVSALNELRDKFIKTCDDRYLNAAAALTPMGLNREKVWSGTYKDLRDIVEESKSYGHDEWRDFRAWVRRELPYAKELIFGGNNA